MAFDPITINSQEELDKLFQERLDRAQKAHNDRVAELEKKLGGEKSELEKKVGTLTTQISELQEKAKSHDSDMAEKDKKLKELEVKDLKTKIAHEAGLSYEAVDFLKGDSEESITESAAAFKKIAGGSNYPSGNPEPDGADDDAAYKALLAGLTKE